MVLVFFYLYPNTCRMQLLKWGKKKESKTSCEIWTGFSISITNVISITNSQGVYKHEYIVHTIIRLFQTFVSCISHSAMVKNLRSVLSPKTLCFTYTKIFNNNVVKETVVRSFFFTYEILIP